MYHIGLAPLFQFTNFVNFEAFIDNFISLRKKSVRSLRIIENVEKVCSDEADADEEEVCKEME